jgi:hypothetical protein
VAFVCTVTQGGFRIQGFSAGTPRLAIVDIGYDNVEPLNYKAAIGLDALPGGTLELYFHIIEADGETGSEHLFWSGRDTRFIADPIDRQTILVSILAGLRALLLMVDPDEFVWFTIDEAPPKRALVKFAAVRQAVERCGYKVTSSRLSMGRRGWKARRLSPNAIDTEGAGPNPIDVRR